LPTHNGISQISEIPQGDFFLRVNPEEIIFQNISSYFTFSFNAKKFAKNNKKFANNKNIATGYLATYFKTREIANILG
jgi:hypothetical protein